VALIGNLHLLSAGRITTAYNEDVARGWESKAIEEQISAAEAREEARAKKAESSLEAEHRRLREGLLLEQSRIVREMRKATKRRYLVLLERALAHVESELERLDRPDPS
jgi:hypothetical protein